MFRKLASEDYEKVMTFLSDEPSINLFIIGDIENYGFEHPKQDVWGYFDPELSGVLLRYRNNFIPYFKNKNIKLEEFKNQILTFNQEKIISGKASIVKDFEDVMDNFTKREMYFCELREMNHMLKVNHKVSLAKVEDAERIYHFLEGIDEFSNIGLSIESIKEKIQTGSGRVYMIESEDQEIISLSQTSAENNYSAMVVGVATNPKYRRQGYMSSCLSQLCTDLLNENKTLCLFYDNPKAGSVYHRLGFESIEKWVMLLQA